MEQEIYVKEMPKICVVDDIPMEKLEMHLYMFDEDEMKQHDKELVEKVFEKIKHNFTYYDLVDEIKEEIDFDKIKKFILDQIQKEFEDE